jgi:hypothetical protein
MPRRQNCQFILCFKTFLRSWPLWSGLPDSSWHNLPKWEKVPNCPKNTKLPQNIPNVYKLYQMAVIYSKWPKIVPKFTQIGIFGLKLYHLATLLLVGYKSAIFMISAYRNWYQNTSFEYRLMLCVNKEELSTLAEKKIEVWLAGAGLDVVCRKPWGRCYGDNFLRFLRLLVKKSAFFSKTDVLLN